MSPRHAAGAWLAGAAAVMAARVLPSPGDAWTMLGALVCAVVFLVVLGRSVLRVLGWQGRTASVGPAALVTGAALGVIVAGVPLLLGLGAAAQAATLVAAWIALEVRGRRQALLPSGLDAWPWASVAYGLMAAWLPLGIGGAWSVAGHDLDTLQHQDGALHATMILTSGEGLRTASGYPLGMHAFLAALAALMDLTSFQAFALGMVLGVAVAAAATAWLALTLGLSIRLSAAAAVLVGIHPLLLFTSMEQFGPQLLAAALCPGAVAAAHDGVGRDHPLARAFLPSMIVAALVSTYGMSVAVAGPAVALAVLAASPWRVAVRRLAWVVGLSLLLAPLGVYRLGERLAGKSRGAESPVKAARRVKTPVVATPGVLAPDATALGDAREATHVLRWEVTAAHVTGMTPYRDQFLRVARMVSTSLGRAVAQVLNAPMWAWANVVVPFGAVAMLLLAAVGGSLAMRRRDAGRALLAFWALPATAGALWLGAGAGIRAYYGFKIASLVLPLLGVAVMAGVSELQARDPRLGRGLVLLLLFLRFPAFLAVEGEYARGLALDMNFTAVAQPTLEAVRGRRATFDDGSATRKYWNSRFLLARAREVEFEEDAEVILCVNNEECHPQGRGKVVARSGGSILWVQRGGQP